MDYAFNLLLKERSENEILKDLIIDLKNENNILSNKYDNILNDNKKMRQCIKLNENTIYDLQKKILKLENTLNNIENECKTSIEQTLSKYNWTKSH